MELLLGCILEPDVQHHTPHFHAYYQEATSIFSIEPINLIAGSIPRKQQRLVEAWAELHQKELMVNWHRLQTGKAPNSIAPLQ